MPDSLLLAVALLCSTIGMGWLALSLDAHWRQACHGKPRATRAKVLRVLGAVALLASLLLCLTVDYATMASLVWIMCLAASALTIAFTLTTRPQLLALFVPGFANSK